MYLYHEPIKGDVYKYKILDWTDDVVVLSSELHKDRFYRLPNKKYPDGSFFLKGVGSFHPETEEWKIKYQNSLSLRVSQESVVVYYVSFLKRGKVNTRALVIDGGGNVYQTMVPTIPLPYMGQEFVILRKDLESACLPSDKELLDKVMEARQVYG